MVATERPGGRTEAIAAAALVGVAFLFGTSFVIVKRGLGYIDPVPYLGLRFAVAGLVLWPVARRRPSHPNEWRAGVLSGFSYIVGMGSQTIGLQSTTPATSAFLTYLLVVGVPFVNFAWYRRRPSRTSILATAIAVAGLVLLTGGGAGFGRGELLTVIGAIAFAVHLVQVGEYAPHQDLFRYNAIKAFTVSLPFLVVAPFAGGFPASAAGLGVAAYAGVVVTALAYLPWMWAQRHIPAARASLILLTEPVFATVAAYVVDGERLAAAAILGAVLILGAAVISELAPALTARSGLESEPPPVP